jgi:hypothetical protein
MIHKDYDSNGTVGRKALVVILKVLGAKTN